MDEAELLLRIRVVVGSTRAAARSLREGDEQHADVLDRGRWLLDALAPAVESTGSVAVRERFARAWEELAELSSDYAERADEA